MLTFAPNTFAKNAASHPSLSKSHQIMINSYMKLKRAPWLLLCHTGPVKPALGSAAPTPAEASYVYQRPAAPHLVYLRHLQRKQQSRTVIEHFSQGYQDYLQAPLQPLTDNLESATYEVFEKDPVKYDQYELAIIQALTDWREMKKPTSGADGKVVVAVAGAGRGPLVTRALTASEKTGVPIEMWAVEKNPNAYVLLKLHNETDWDGAVTIVKSDMRAWKGPLKATDGDSTSAEDYGKVDILISELLGSFGDNELSPECLDGVQHVLATGHGISIPSSYTAHCTPVLAPRIHAEIARRTVTDPTAPETPYVVLLQQIDYAAMSVPDHPRFQEVWEFVHPVPEDIMEIATQRRQGGVSGGGGGSMVGGDGANEHNIRYARLKFVCKDRTTIHGLAGYFESVLYASGESSVELSTRPDTIDIKSKDMMSWFPIYFPLKVNIFFMYLLF